MRINDDDLLEVYAVRPDKVYVFDSAGQLRSTRTVSPYFTFGSGHVEGRANNDKGDVFEVRTGALFPHVVKVAANGRETTVVRTPWHKWIWMGPLPAWGFAAMGIGLLAWADKLNKAKRGGDKTGQSADVQA